MRKALTGIVLLFTLCRVHAQTWQYPTSNTYFNGGNVGIGTTTPQRILHIAGTNSVEALIEATDDGYAMLDFKANGKTWQWSKRPGAEGDAFQLYYHNGSAWQGPYFNVTPG